MESGDKNRDVSDLHASLHAYFVKHWRLQKLRKDWFERCRAFSGTGRSMNFIAWKRWLLLNNWLNTSPPISGREKKKNLYEQNFDGEANWPSVVNFHCMQIECCDKHADYFRRWLKHGAKFFTFSYFGNNVFSLESKPLIFVYLCARTKQNWRIRNEK